MSRVVELSTENMEAIGEIARPFFTATDMQTFSGFMAQIADGHESLATLLRKKEEALRPSRTKEADEKDWISDVALRRKQTEAFITDPQFRWSRGRLNALRGFGEMKRKGLPEHPWLMPLTTEAAEAVEALRVAQEALREASRQVEKQQDPVIARVREGILATEGSLFNLTEKRIIVSTDAPISYLGIVPERGNNLAEKYANSVLDDYTRIIDWGTFEAKIRAEYFGRSNSPVQRFLDANKKLNDFPFERLPREIQSRVRQALTKQKLAEWQTKLVS